MNRVYNFSPGPAMLPEEVLLQAQREMLDWNNTGMSIMEFGHRSSEFKVLAEQSEADLRELMAIPKNYQVLFLAGGASTQFGMLPINLSVGQSVADYFDTGIWSKKAIDEARRYLPINIVGKTEIKNDLIHITPANQWNFTPNAGWVHYTPNETIEGIEFHAIPDTGNVPLVADMTSCILSREIDVNRFGIIYAGTQKNLGQAGLNIVIIREDLIRDPIPTAPTLYSYQVQAQNKSLYNTPPTYAWYITGLVLQWMKKQGGVKVFEKNSRLKAKKLYDFIDQKKDFYLNSVHPDCRSLANIPFNLIDNELTEMFLEQAKQAGLTNLKGHRLAGGVRASIYNPMPEAGVDALIRFMDDFANRYG